MASLGNVGASALVKSAASIASQVNAYQDKLAAQTWADSAKTDADWQTYQSYLGSRITNLQDEDSLSSASSALSLQNTLTTASHSYVSASITRTAQQILEGNATLQDKDNQIIGFYNQAVANGDDDLAQSLVSQHDSLSQQIQYQAAQQSSTYTSDLKSSYTGAIMALNQGLTDIYTTFKNGNEQEVTKALNDFATSQGTLLNSLGIDLPKGDTLTMANITAAVIQGRIALNQSAAQALTEAGDTTDATSFTNDANNLLSGATKLSTPTGSMNAQDVANWEQNANLYRTNTSVNGENSYAENGVTGYKVINGQPVPQSEGNAQGSRTILTNNDPNFDNNAATALKQAGLTVVSTNGSGYQVQFTKNSDKWTQSGSSNPDIKSGSTVTLIPQSNGSFQFDKNGSVYTLGSDTRGLIGLQQTNSTGVSKLVAGQYGFNQKFNTVVSSDPLAQIQSNQNFAKNGAGIQPPVAAPLKGTPITPIAQATSQILGVPMIGPKTPVPTAKPIVSTSIKPGTTLTAAMQSQAQQAIAAFQKLDSSTQLQTYKAIQTSAGYGNPYDQYKLTLLGNSGYTGQPALSPAGGAGSMMIKIPGAT